MAFDAHIIKGIGFILSHQNDDNGIPATMPGDPSGCWTTADSLEAFLLSPCYPIEQVGKLRQLVLFLLDSQLESGGWELVKDNGITSTMATGHAIAALSIYNRKFTYKSNEIIRAIKKGLSWLQNFQNEDGSWGPEPDNLQGKSGRVISTFYALKGLFENDLSYQNSRSVTKAIDYMLTLRRDQGWSGIAGSHQDYSNVARIVSCLVRSKKYQTSHKLVKSGIRTIIKNKSKWDLNTESFVSSTAAGETVFNSNTPYDLLEVFNTVRYFGDEVFDLCMFYKDNQEDDGRWHLSYKKGSAIKEKNITTWSTAEAITGLSLSQIIYVREKFPHLKRGISPYWRNILIAAAAIIVFQLLLLLDIPQKLTIVWLSIPEQTKSFVIFGIVLTILLAVFANLITPFFSSILAWILKRFKNDDETN